MLRFGDPEKCMNRRFGFFIPLGHKTADDVAFGTLQRERKSRPGVKRPPK
jgi:hypothetical protein